MVKTILKLLTHIGVLFNYNGRFKKGIEKQINQARKAMFSMMVKVYRLQLPLSMQYELFDTLVCPILTYGSEVWGYENLQDIEIFHRKFLKSTLNLKASTPDSMVYGESGRYKLEKVIINKMVNYWCRILNGKETKLCHIMYKVLRSMHYNENTNFNSPWIEKLEQIFNGIGMTNVWENEGDGFSAGYIKHAVKHKIDDTKQQEWHENMYSKKQCVFYRMFKEDLKIENYFDKLDKKDRISLVKFRCRNNNLPVVKSTYTKNEEDRYCHLCNERETGDEVHYLFKCTAFKAERQMCFQKESVSNVNVFKISRTMNYKSVSNLKKLARFAAQIMSKFTKIIKSNSDMQEATVVKSVASTRCGRIVNRPLKLDL